MAEESARRNQEKLSAREFEAYNRNYLAHKPGISPEESTKVYDQWTTYEQDVPADRYRGPLIAATAVAEFFREGRENVLILDVACGTGFVGEELKKAGFQRMHGLDPSLKLLEKAREKKVFQKDFQCYLDSHRLPIDDDAYDCAVIAGGMGEGHIPTAGLHELARIVKPGGLVCIVMREEYLQYVAEYRDRLENTMKEMEEAGVWTLTSRVVVPKYSFDNNGVVFKFVVC